MPITEIKSDIIKTIINSNDDGLLLEIKELLEENPFKDELKESASLLGAIDWHELQIQLNDHQEEKYTWAELMAEIEKSRK